jgi:hypothetical protein
MSNINVIAQLVPKNDANFALADTIHLKGGYIQVASLEELQATLAYTSRLKEGMLAFVVDVKKFYQLLDNTWKIWQPEAGASLVLHTVATTSELKGSSLEVKGQVVYVEDIDGLLYYSGTTWNSFTRIYIQSTAPTDKSGIWIDSTDSGVNESSSVVSDLYRLINILAKKVSQLEYMNQQIQSGGFSNNMYDEYGNITGIDPGDEISGITDADKSDGTTEEEDLTEEELLANTLLADSSEPTEYKDTLPNVKHIQIKWGSYQDMIKYKDNFLPAELLFCYNVNELYIKHPKTNQLIKIGATTSGGGDDTTDDIMNGIIQSGDYISSISFVDMVDTSKHYTFSVKHGKLDLYNEELDVEPLASAQELLSEGYYKQPYLSSTKPYGSTNINSLILINMVYATGNAGYTANNPCNFNFIELSNLCQYDINLNGYYLHYSEGEAASTGRTWITLPLKGVIKAQSTYLIKGARAGLDKFARVKVGEPDMYFSKNVAKNPDIFETTQYSVWDSEGMLKINNTCAFFLTGPFKPSTGIPGYTDKTYSDYLLTQGPFTCSAPWIKDSNSNFGVVYGYVDLAGFGTSMPNVANGSITALSPNSISVLYYTMDNVTQAYKSVMGDNKPNWTYIDLVTTPQEIEVADYSPKNSEDGKNMFFNKHLLEEGSPQFVTTTFGYNPHTTRCFTWVSVGYRDEYLRYRKQGDAEWTILESFKSGDDRTAVRNRDNAIYNRIRSVTTDGTYFTSHKCIVDLYDPEGDGPESTEIWEYQVGYNEHWTDIHTFTLRNKATVAKEGFEFLQVTDQQGFNQEEYEEWRLVAETINRDYVDSQQYELTSFSDETLQTLPLKTSLPATANSEEPNIFVVTAYYKKQQDTTDTSVYTYVVVTDEETKAAITTKVQSIPTASTDSVDSFILGKGYTLQKHNVEFVINTGDATQNGNRINEWVDYFKAGEVLFKHLDQMYTVGNNDLCPVTPYELGLGTDTTKQNPVNVNYFFTFEHPYSIPVSSTGVYVPCFYSFIYGNTYFLCANSEITDSGDGSYALFGQQGGPLYQTLKAWCDEDLTHAGNPDWKIAYCHENPFTLLVASTMTEYDNALANDENAVMNNRGSVTSHFNSPGDFWFSKFLEDNQFNLSICGHKHTYTTSRYIHDNEENRMKPYVYDASGENATFITKDNKNYMIVTNDTSKWYVKYSMCQATGYKLVSNKELPGRNIGWLESYYPITAKGAKNNGQLYPHFIVWKVGSGVETENPLSPKAEARDIILGKPKKVYPHFGTINSVSAGSNKLFKYNTLNFKSDVMRVVGGNGESSDNNIVVEHLEYNPT